MLFFMNYCYILYSKKLDVFYIGATQGPLESRIEKHNLHTYGKGKFTATTNDWQLFQSIPCDSFSQALAIERHIKRMKSRKYLENLKQYPELIQKLISKYST